MIRGGQRYLVTFNDTTVVTPGREDTVRTKDFSLWRVNSEAYSDLDRLRTTPSASAEFVSLLEEVIFPQSEALVFEGNLATSGIDKNVAEGFYLSFANVPQVAPDYARLGWTQSAEGIYPGDMFIFRSGFDQGTKTPFDYQLVMGPAGSDTSTAIFVGGINFQKLPVNFSVVNITRGERVRFAFLDGDRTDSTTESALFTRTRRQRDIILLLEEVRGEETPTWVDHLWANVFRKSPQPNRGRYAGAVH